MSAEGPTPYTIARGEIDGWRGHCLDLFARSERAVALSLEAARQHGRQTRLRHLAGQRLDDLLALVGHEKPTPKQHKTLTGAIEAWREIEVKRVFLAHGIATELLDRTGGWYACFHLTTYNGTVGTADRWTITKSEADAFEVRLSRSFVALSSQLGQLRQRLSD